ncbi:MAG: PucC family protein, partial [Pseudomonadota bacterium]
MHAPVSAAKVASAKGLNWFAIARIGLVQACVGALVMMATTVLNRLMIVEIGLVGSISGGLVAWHYVIQLGRPIWGHGSDQGGNRSVWIVGGIAVLAAGVLMATQATLMMGSAGLWVFVFAALAYTVIGVGVGAAGTSALALLASSVAPDRRAAAAALTWIMMIAGIVASSFAVGELIEPFTPQALMRAAIGLSAVAIVVAFIATFRLERG